MEMKTKQQRIENVLTSKNITFDRIDISSSEEDKNKMREIVGDPKALPPQITNDDVYCGDFEAFELALENETLNEFLKL